MDSENAKQIVNRNGLKHVLTMDDIYGRLVNAINTVNKNVEHVPI